MKVFKIAAVFALLSSTALAQQSPIYNTYFLNSEFYNPSAVGIGTEVRASTIYKQYMTGFTGNPTSTFLSLSAPLKSNEMGVGLNMYNDRTGIVNRFNIQGAYAYRLQLGRSHSLDFGVSIGLLQTSVDPDQMELDNVNDQLLTNKNFSSGMLDGNFGLTYKFANLKVELAANHLLELDNRFSDLVTYSPVRHFLATASYEFFFGPSKTFSMTPFILARFSQFEVPQEAAIIFSYKDVLKLAPSYKNNGALAVSAAATVYDGLTVGYSYETGARNFGAEYQKGAHEVFLRYSFTSAKAALKEQQKKIDDLDAKLEEYQEFQRQRDAAQDSTLSNQQKEIDENKKGVEGNKEAIENQSQEMKELDEKVQNTQKELEDLKAQLKKSGVLREGTSSEFENAPKGYYIVLASVNERNYNETAMQKEYLSKGYKKIFSEKRGWHYVYKVQTDDFADALTKLKEARANENPKAWILILK